MKQYIKYINNNFIDHPVLEDNLLQVYPDFTETNNYGYILFNRVDIPKIADFEVLESEHYIYDSGTAKNEFNIRPMTQQEAINKKQQLIEQCIRDANYLLSVIDQISSIMNLTEQQKQEYKQKLQYFALNPVMYPKLCCTGEMPYDTGKSWPEMYN